MLTLERRDGRRLRYEIFGPADGQVVFCLHGSPGSRLGPRATDTALESLGMRLVCYDRPGYGGSDPQPDRSMADVANDVAALADALGVSTFAAYGISGGGPPALACAALLPDRVSRMVAMASPAPYDADGLEWTAGMNDGNVAGYQLARMGRDAFMAEATENRDEILLDRFAFIWRLERSLPAPDRAMLSDPVLRDGLAAGVAEGLRAGVEGRADDAVALTSPWGFDPGSIAVPRSCGMANSTCSHRSLIRCGWLRTFRAQCSYGNQTRVTSARSPLKTRCWHGWYAETATT